MSRQTEKLYAGITGIRDDLIKDTEDVALKKKPKNWKRWTALAACAAVIVGIGGTALLRGGLGGSNAGSGGSGHAEGSVFMSYAGPVFPLAAVEQTDGITVRRNVSYDFSLLGPQGDWETQHQRQLTEHNVTDAYTLVNTTSQEQTLTLCYPAAIALSDPANRLPTILVNREAADTTLYAGPYSGGFTAAVGDDPDANTLNLEQPRSWEAYYKLLQDGSYQERAMDAYPDLSRPVIVYEFTNEAADHEKWPAATLAIEFSEPAKGTHLLTWGFSGSSWDNDTGLRSYSYFVPKENDSDYGRPRYLIVAGGDIGSYELKGYQDGGCEDGEEVADIYADIRRFETTLGEILQSTAQSCFKQYERGEDGAAILSYFPENSFLGLSAELLCDHGLLSDTPVMRYVTGMLGEIFSETLTQKRIVYQTFSVSIPAGGSVDVTAAAFKDASYDFACSGSNNVGVSGYDLVTTLGSSLAFIEQTATLTNADGIEIVRQNFGFDLDAGLTTVTLDPTQEHYYLEVRNVL